VEDFKAANVESGRYRQESGEDFSESASVIPIEKVIESNLTSFRMNSQESLDNGKPVRPQSFIRTSSLPKELKKSSSSDFKQNMVAEAQGDSLKTHSRKANDSVSASLTSLSAIQAPKINERQSSFPTQGTTHDVKPAQSNPSSLPIPIEPLFVKSVNRVVDGVVRIHFIFQIWKAASQTYFIEKGEVNFLALLAELKRDFADIPALPEKSQFAIGATGNALQAWLKKIFISFPDFPAVIEFLNSSIIKQNQLRESFKRSGQLYKKGNYFGAWKTRYYELDTASGTIFYSDTPQGEVLGSFSLQHAYAGPGVPSNNENSGKKEGENIDLPSFVVIEYKKSFFNTQPSLDSRNADGLPNGKAEFRHIFYSTSSKDRDQWLRCITGVIARFRPDDRLAQYFFTLTTPPDPDSKGAKVSQEVSAKVEEKSRITNEPSNKIADSTPSTPTVTFASDLVQVQKQNTKNDPLTSSPQRPRPAGMVNQSLSKPIVSVTDDQSRCESQPVPPLLVDAHPLPTSLKTATESGKKKNIFKDWMKRGDSSSKVKFGIFGVSIAEATESSPIYKGIEIPAILYRCIEYLEHKNSRLI
jgi:hypothetical protein